MNNSEIEEEIIQLAHETCKTKFMDYPDYDEDIELNLMDALTIIVHDITPHTSNMTSDKLNEFFNSIL